MKFESTHLKCACDLELIELKACPYLSSHSIYSLLAHLIVILIIATESEFFWNINSEPILYMILLDII